ncbi:MAG TPA: peptide ABC transporter substrate-binding protein [Pyrinomonadaceae bacterium]|jgi:oligopeptide transport system substrate-binding protein
MRLQNHSSALRLSGRLLRRVALMLLLLAASCASPADEAEYFGKLKPPQERVLRYISGPEPESLDPQIGTGQPETRLYMALFEGLAEYDPRTMEPIPAIAESWETNADSTEFVFRLRPNARWSNGESINAHDFVYSWRRALSPALASRNAYLAYYIKYAQGYNSRSVFVRDPATGDFLLDKDFQPDSNSEASKTTSATTTTKANPSGASSPAEPAPVSDSSATPSASPFADTPFRRFISSPARLVLPGDEKKRQKILDADARLREAVAGKEFVPVKAEDIGVEAIDDLTLRVTLAQPAPFFIGLVPHPFLRAVPRRSIEQHKAAWTRPENIITGGPFKLETWKPYHEISVVRDPFYWDAARVRLDRIFFYAVEENTTMMNLYKAGDVDAIGNHYVPSGWIDAVRPLKDYMDAPEIAIIYYLVNVTKPPMSDVRVRKAFNMAINKQTLADWRKVPAPLHAFTPSGIFPGYPQPTGDAFDPARARQLLAEAGFRNDAGAFDPAKFPAGEVEIMYATAESNRHVAEFVQAQWKQNLGITVSLRNMEFKTFLANRAKLSYKGFANAGYAGDYIDPFTFLNLLAAPATDNGTGWWDARYVSLLNEANRTIDKTKRYELLAKAEAYLIDAQPFIPLYVPSTKWMKKPYVKGMYANPGTLHAWKFVYIEPEQAKWNADSLDAHDAAQPSPALQQKGS